MQVEGIRTSEARTSMISSSDSAQTIKESQLENFILELNNDIDNISSMLDNIESIMYDTKDHFKGDVANALYDKFEFYQKQIQVLKQNLNSYSDDLITIKNSMVSNDSNIQNAWTAFIEGIASEANRISNS